MRFIITIIALSYFFLAFSQTNYDYSKLQREQLGRGLVAIRQDNDSVVLSWRYLSSDPENIAFDIYRDGMKSNAQPITTATFYKEALPTSNSPVAYELRNSADDSIIDSYTLPADAPSGYINIPLNIPPEGITPAGQKYSYTANDASIGDVDGDGRYEIILKWEPTNAHDNAHDGYTGNVLFDCYTLDGNQLWRIDLGRNVRAGAHYTQFMVYDLDGDDMAEVVMKTADGTIDGIGNIIGDADADYREHDKNQGRILSGPEYLTVFSGLTGEAISTINYIPQRGKPEDWGDNRANRSDRFLACIAYLDGIHPSVVMCRGYYTRTVLAAFDLECDNLLLRWLFDSNNPGCEKYAGQGNHNLRVIDVDGDGCDEIIYGQCAIDHDGKGLYTTGMGHGDAMHVTQFSADDETLYVWGCHENKRDGSSFRNARTGEVIWQVKSNKDVGRCMTADIDPTNPGLELWSANTNNPSGSDGSRGLRNIAGGVVNPEQKTISMNSAVWWDGDLNRELLDHNKITKYDWTIGKCVLMEEFDQCASNNWTKGNACLSGDIVGDWREEVLLRTPDNTALRLYVTTIPTQYRFHTFLEDIPYRIGIATQNVAYNQPPHPSFYFGSDFKPGTKVRGTIIK